MSSRYALAVMMCMLGLWATPGTAQLRFTFSRDTIDLGSLGPCEDSIAVFDIVNTGTEIIAAPDTSRITGFVVWTADASNIAPGERRQYFVRFTGTTSRPVYRTQHIITLTISGRSASDTMLLIARRLPGRCCVLRVDSLAARPGDRVDVVIHQDSTPARADLSAVQITMAIAYDPTSLVPDANVPGEIDRTTGTITLRVPLRDDDGPVATIPCTAVLGRVVTTPLGIDWYSLSVSGLNETTYGGSFTVLGVCRDGGRARGFDPTVASTLRMRQQGAMLELECDAPMRVDVVDVTGRVVDAATVHGMHTVGPLSRGMYIVRGDASQRSFLVYVD